MNVSDKMPNSEGRSPSEKIGTSFLRISLNCGGVQVCPLPTDLLGVLEHLKRSRYPRPAGGPAAEIETFVQIRAREPSF